MKYWKYCKMENGGMMTYKKPLLFGVDCIHFKQFNHSIVKSKRLDNSVVYTTECIRYKGNTRMKIEGTFIVDADSYGYCLIYWTEAEI